MSSQQTNFIITEVITFVSTAFKTFKEDHSVLISPAVLRKVDGARMPVWMRAGKSNQNTIMQPSMTSN